MSETPRTYKKLFDLALIIAHDDKCTDARTEELAKHARDLETELAAMKIERDTWRFKAGQMHLLYLETEDENTKLSAENLRLSEENDTITGLNQGQFLELEYLRKVHKAAHALYTESEEYDFDDGLGKGAGQQYWDDLADAFEPETDAIAEELDNNARLREAEFDLDEAKSKRVRDAVIDLDALKQTQALLRRAESAERELSTLKAAMEAARKELEVNQKLLLKNEPT